MIKFIFKNFFKKYYFSFIYGHSHFDKKKIKKIKKLIFNEDLKVVKKYENAFSKFIGSGESISFATARMALYSYLLSIGIKNNDEVIVIGFTCSVVINAILRTGAKPIFCDINLKNFSNSKESIFKICNKKTKLIIVQHTFGIPSEIKEIIEFSKKRKIRVLEDCAISFGSSVNGEILGNFGDAAIFSTDHSKPINTIVGGILYSKNKKVIEKVRRIRDRSFSISLNKKLSIYRRFLFERFFFRPKTYGKGVLFEYFFNKIFEWSFSFDSGPNAHSKYPYPLKLPSFIAKIGLYELEYWKSNKINIQLNIKNLLHVLKKNLPKNTLPFVYFDSNFQIYSNRIIFYLNKEAKIYLNLLERIIDIRWIWFKKPIIDTKNELHEFGYVSNSCFNSEKIGEKIINIPVPYSKKDTNLLIESLDVEFKKIKKRI